MIKPLNIAILLFFIIFSSLAGFGQVEEGLFLSIEELIGKNTQRASSIIDSLSQIKGLNSEEHAEILLLKSRIAAKSGDLINAWEFGNSAIDTVEKFLPSPGALKIISKLGTDYGRVSFYYKKYTEGLENLQRLLDKFTVLEPLVKGDIAEKKLGLANMLNRKVLLLRINGKLKEALEVSDAVMDMIDQVPVEKREDFKSFALSERAQLFVDLYQLRKAIEIYKRILDMAINQGNQNRIAVYSNNIGIAYYRMGDFGNSRAFLEKSLEALKKKVKNPLSPQLMGKYNNLCIISMELGDLDSAERYNQRYLKIAIKALGNENADVADVYYNEGSIQYLKGNIEKAMKSFKESNEIYELTLGKDHPRSLESRYKIGVSMVDLGRYEEGKKILEQVKKKYEKAQGNKSVEMEVMSYLAKIAMHDGDDKKIEFYLDKAMRSVGYDPYDKWNFDLIQGPINLGLPLDVMLDWKVRKYKENKKSETYDEAVEILQLCDSLISYIKINFDDNETRKILNGQLQSILDKGLDLYYLYHLYNQESNGASSFFSILEQGNNSMLYQYLMEDENSKILGVPRDLLLTKNKYGDSVLVLAKQISTLISNKDLQSPQVLVKLNAFRDSLEMVKENIRNNFPKYYEQMYSYPLLSMEQVKSLLKPDDLLLMYGYGADQLYLLEIRKNRHKIHIIGDAHESDVLIDSLIFKLRDPHSTGYIEKGSEVYDLLLGQVDILPQDQIIVVPEGKLSLLPFSALYNAQKNKFLCQTNVVRYGYSSSLLFEDKASDYSPMKDLVMAPIFDYHHVATNDSIEKKNKKISALHLSKEEAEEIALILGVSPVLRDGATETFFKKNIHDKRVIHLATHGVVDYTSPVLSALYFWNIDQEQDGKLHAYEIINMDLDADLITLSACNTSVGIIEKGEGVNNIGRAFACAGILNQFTSLWGVNDKSTKELMIHFYENLKKGMNKPKAVQNAKLKYLESSIKTLRHPYYWAGFVYYGDDLPLPQNDKKWWHYALWLTVVSAVVIFVVRKGRFR